LLLSSPASLYSACWVSLPSFFNSLLIPSGVRRRQ
jgi:hypothetical protein